MKNEEKEKKCRHRKQKLNFIENNATEFQGLILIEKIESPLFEE